MTMQSTTRRHLVAAVLVTVLAAVVAAGSGTAHPLAAGLETRSLPELPEVVVAATRQPS